MESPISSRASASLILPSATRRFSIPSPVRRAGRASRGSWSGIRSRKRPPQRIRLFPKKNQNLPTPRKPWRCIPVTKITSPMMWRFAPCALTSRSLHLLRRSWTPIPFPCRQAASGRPSPTVKPPKKPCTRSTRTIFAGTQKTSASPTMSWASAAQRPSSGRIWRQSIF